VSVARRIAKNSIVQAAAFAVQGLTEFVVALVLARSAGAERLGEFTTLIILAGLFAFISAFGLPGLLTREISRVRDDDREIGQLVNGAFGLVIVLSTGAFFLMLAVGIVSSYSPTLLRALILTAIALGIESMAMSIAAAFRGIESLEKSSAVIAVMEATFMLLAVPVVLLREPIDVLMSAYVASRLFGLFIAAWFYRHRFGRLRPTLDWPMWRSLLTKGLPFSVNSVFSFAYSRADVVILSYIAGNTAVGFYEVAYSLTMRTNVVARAVTFALYPLLSHQFSKDQQSMRAYTAGGIHFLNIASFFLAIVLWAFGAEVVGLIYGQPFAEATGTAVKVLTLAIPLRFLETSLGVSLDASNRAGLRATAVAVAALTNAGLNLILIPRYSMMGAVYATVLTEVEIVAIFVWLLREHVREIIAWRAFVAPTLGVLLVVAGLALFSGLNVLVSLPLSIAVYVGAIVILDRSSVRSVRQLAIGRQT
jgi:O-antigen/teichoic acid export membrane protein